MLNSFEILKSSVKDDLKSVIKLLYVFKTYNNYYENWYFTALFVTIDDKVFGLGYNYHGVCGQGYNDRIFEPLVIIELCDKNVKEFFNGLDFVLCLTSDNKVFSWGMNDHGQLGIGCAKSDKYYEPQLVEFFNDKKIVQVCCGERHSLVLTEEGVVYGWGDNTCGQTGIGEESEQIISSPTPWTIDIKVNKIHCSNYQSFAITEEGNVYCCGLNDHCQLGSQLKINGKAVSPMLKGVINVQDIITGHSKTYFVTKNGDIYLNKSGNTSLIKSNLTNIISLSSWNYFFNNLEYCIISSEDAIYELHEDEIQKTDYITPEEYFNDKGKNNLQNCTYKT